MLILRQQMLVHLIYGDLLLAIARLVYLQLAKHHLLAQQQLEIFIHILVVQVGQQQRLLPQAEVEQQREIKQLEFLHWG